MNSFLSTEPEGKEVADALEREEWKGGSGGFLQV